MLVFLLKIFLAAFKENNEGKVIITRREEFEYLYFYSKFTLDYFKNHNFDEDDIWSLIVVRNLGIPENLNNETFFSELYHTENAKEYEYDKLNINYECGRIRFKTRWYQGIGKDVMKFTIVMSFCGNNDFLCLEIAEIENELRIIRTVCEEFVFRDFMNLN